jgi:hypothetical protein
MEGINKANPSKQGSFSVSITTENGWSEKEEGHLVLLLLRGLRIPVVAVVVGVAALALSKKCEINNLHEILSQGYDGSFLWKQLVARRLDKHPPSFGRSMVPVPSSH